MSEQVSGIYRNHLVDRHEETPESVADLLAETAMQHPGKPEEWLLDLIHNRQHTSLDWDAGHDEADLHPMNTNQKERK